MRGAVSVLMLAALVCFVVQASGGYQHAIETLTLPHVISPRN